MKRAHFPWRPLGTLLVDDGLLNETQLELALAEQRRTGRMLGQIVVDFGYLTPFSLARVLAEQHGVELRRRGLDGSGEEPADDEPSDDEAAAIRGETGGAADEQWRPLGTVLVDQGFLTEADLELALEEQRRQKGVRLGQVLVDRGLLTGAALGRALAAQHGVHLGSEDELEETVQAVVKAAVSDEPTFQVCEVALEPSYRTSTVLYTNVNFLEATDFAFEFVDAHRPDALEIRRIEGDTSETVWMYSESRAMAASQARRGLVDTFGFDPTSWGQPIA